LCAPGRLNCTVLLPLGPDCFRLQDLCAQHRRPRPRSFYGPTYPQRPLFDLYDVEPLFRFFSVVRCLSTISFGTKNWTTSSYIYSLPDFLSASVVDFYYLLIARKRMVMQKYSVSIAMSALLPIG